MIRSRREGCAEVDDDPVDLHEQRGVSEPLAFVLVGVGRIVVLERQPGAAIRALRAALPPHANLVERARDVGVARLAEHVSHQGANGLAKATRRAPMSGMAWCVVPKRWA